MGRATTMRFLQEGASVVIADYNEDTAHRRSRSHPTMDIRDRVRFIRTDVAKEPQVAAMIDLAMSDFGRVDIVFNNAGVAARSVPFGMWKWTNGITPSMCSRRASSSASSMRPAR